MRDIVIEDNRIADTGSVGIAAEAADGLCIAGNDLAGLNQLQRPDGGYGVRLADTAAPTVVENTVTAAAGSAFTAFGLRQGCTSLTASANTVTVDGSRRSGAFEQRLPVTLTFNRTVVPDSGSRSVAVRCFWLELIDTDGAVVRRVTLCGGEGG
jgi:hypothetical protein